MKWWARLAVLSLTLAGTLFGQLPSAPDAIQGTVVDLQDRPVVGASVALTTEAAAFRTETNENGEFVFRGQSAGTLRVTLAGFAPLSVSAQAGGLVRLLLHPARVTESVVVSATRSDLPEEATASSTHVLPSEQIASSASFTLDDKLRQVPGLELFRRSSSRVSNPTSQGVSLRGLGSTAASRTLVLADQIPVNDPFGGWVHWDEMPQLLIEQAEAVRGGGSDLYGSSAIGGVIDLVEHPPTVETGELQLGYGMENTPEINALYALSRGPWHGEFAGDFFRTDGYVLVAPAARGAIDINSNVHYQNADVQIERTFGSRGSTYLGANMLNEARSNGTVLQNNATRLWRYDAGLDWNTSTSSTVKLRAYGATEHYRQSFSSVASDRNSETLTRLQRVPTGELGLSGQYLQSFGAHFTLLAGADVQDVRAMDFENTFFHVPTGYIDTTARQRETGVYGEGILQWSQWTVTSSVRFDDFKNLDAQQWTLSKGTFTSLPIADRTENVGNPRLGVVRRVTSSISLTATAFRAFRSPTMNELYRTGQVGQQITLANPTLRSERATGWETGVQFAQPSRDAVVRASYFWTEVNRPVTALTLSSTPTSTLLKRDNLGQIRSRGVSLDYEVAARRWLLFTGGYQYALATVTRFDQNPALIGNWIPQVPRNTGTAQATATSKRWGTFSIQGRATGRQFDDDKNRFLLHGFFRFDAFASYPIAHHWEVFAAGENLFDRTIQVGRTPVLTLGTPRLVQGGVRVFLDRR